MCAECDDNSTDEIEITEEMVDAGEAAFSASDPRFDDAGMIVIRVFAAMIDASPYRLARKSE